MRTVCCSIIPAGGVHNVLLCPRGVVPPSVTLVRYFILELVLLLLALLCLTFIPPFLGLPSIQRLLLSWFGRVH